MNHNYKKMTVLFLSLGVGLIFFSQACAPLGSALYPQNLASRDGADSLGEERRIDFSLPQNPDDEVPNSGPIEEDDNLNRPPDRPINDEEGDYLFVGNFQNGSLNSQEFRDFWGLRYGSFPNNGQLVTNPDSAFEGQSLQVRYPANVLGSNQRVQFASDFDRLGVPNSEALYLRYYLKFHPGFDFGKGGKLPGFSGGEGRSGGQNVDGTNGWSTRYMWRRNNSGREYLVVYAYVDGKYGDNYTYGFDFEFMDQNTGESLPVPIGEWVCLEQYVRLNDLGSTNGQIKAWMNNELGVDVTDVQFRTVDNHATRIGELMFSTFYGGGDNSWAPSRETYISFDNFVISENRIGCNN